MEMYKFTNKTKNVAPKCNVNITLFLLLICVIVLNSLNISKVSANTSVIYSSSSYVKEQQFAKKIQIIKDVFPSQIDEIVLAATVLYDRSASEVIEDQYDENFSESEYRNQWKEISNTASSLNPADHINPRGSKYTDENIDLLTAAAIVMLDSSAWFGSYDEEKYKDFLAGDKLVGNGFNKDNPAEDFVGNAFNTAFCTVGAITDSFVTFGFDLALGMTDSMERKATRYANMTSICQNGFIGGVFEGVKDIQDEDQKQARKDTIAQGIIDLANYYKRLMSQQQESSKGSICYYKIPGIEEEVSNIKVQTIQCEYGNETGGVGDDIPGEGLIDFENTYIPGVVYPEVGGADAETRKAQAVAARSYALTRGNAMNGAYNIGLSIQDGQWVLRIRTCTSDQVFCHPDLGCGSLDGSMQGTTSGGSTVYAGGKNGNLTRQPLAADDELRTTVAETKGEVAIDSNGEVVYTSFASNDQNSWANAVASGKDYKTTIINHYRSNGVVAVESDCRGGDSVYDLENYYQLSQAASQSKNKPSVDLASAKTYKTVDAFNKHIQDNVNSAGYGTREAVVAAGISLVGDYIVETGKRLRYNQLAGNYGIPVSRQDPETVGIVNDNFYMDCSSFAWWALYNGGFKLPSYAQTGQQLSWASNAGYTKAPGPGAGQAGDFLVSTGHIVLILGTYDNGYYVAEFSSWTEGAKINKYEYGTSTSGFYVIDMTEYYNNASNRR